MPIPWVKINEDPGDHLLLQLGPLQPHTAFHTQLLGHRCSPGPNGELRGILAVVGRQGSSVASAEICGDGTGKIWEDLGSVVEVRPTRSLMSRGYAMAENQSTKLRNHLSFRFEDVWRLHLNSPPNWQKKTDPLQHCSTTQSCPVSCWEPSDSPKFPPRPVLGADLRMSVFPGLLPPWWNKGQSSPVTAPAAGFNVFAGPGRHVAGMSCQVDMSKTKETKVSPDPEETES